MFKKVNNSSDLAEKLSRIKKMIQLINKWLRNAILIIKIIMIFQIIRKRRAKKMKT